MEKKYPKILLVSHNALSKTQNNGKTIETFFKEWPKEKIMHLYFSAEYEDLEFCSNSFCVHDYDALDNFLRIKKKQNGRELYRQLNHEVEKEKYKNIVRKIYSKNRMTKDKGLVMNYLHKEAVNRNRFLYLLRFLVWKNKKWYINDIFNWVEKNKPSIIFFQGGNMCYSYELVYELGKKFNIPIILECTDDYTKKLNEKSLIETYLNKKYLVSFKKMINLCESIFVISEKMAKEYSSLYGGKNYYVLSNSVERNIENKKLDISKKIKFIYAGNLGLKRWEVLYSLGTVLNTINVKYKINTILEIYSGTILEDAIINKFKKLDSINFKGFISQEQLDKVIEKSDILVHVESFDEFNKKITRLSISTKIGEYLASNRAILAIGPHDVASVEYLSNKEAACVITSNDPVEIEKCVHKIIFNDIYREKLINKAREEYMRSFTQNHINEIVYESVSNAIESYS